MGFFLFSCTLSCFENSFQMGIQIFFQGGGGCVENKYCTLVHVVNVYIHKKSNKYISYITLSSLFFLRFITFCFILQNSKGLGEVLQPP